MAVDYGYPGFQQLNTLGSEFNALKFIIDSSLAQIRTATVVKIISCTNSGGVSPFGFVDVRPMVSMVNGDDEPTDHGIIYKCVYLRVQGGTNAVIIDPQVGDIGIACFADRDISAVQTTQDYASPPSRRMFDMADAMYLGGVLNAAPTQYIQFNESGISVISPTKITVTAPSVEINGETTINGDTTIVGALSQSGGNSSMAGSLSVTGAITGAGIGLSTHKHSGVTTGGGNTGTPV